MHSKPNKFSKSMETIQFTWNNTLSRYIVLWIWTKLMKKKNILTYNLHISRISYSLITFFLFSFLIYFSWSLDNLSSQYKAFALYDLFFSDKIWSFTLFLRFSPTILFNIFRPVALAILKIKESIHKQYRYVSNQNEKL